MLLACKLALRTQPLVREPARQECSPRLRRLRRKHREVERVESINDLEVLQEERLHDAVPGVEPHAVEHQDPDPAFPRPRPELTDSVLQCSSRASRA